MTNRSTRRRYRKSSGRHVWVFSELNHELRPEQIAKIITTAGLEQARREAEARTQDIAARDDSAREESPEESHHA